MSLFTLPHEILEHILSYLYPVDIIRLGQTSRQARTAVQPSNNLLWRSAFLHVYDDPVFALDVTRQSTDLKRCDSNKSNSYWYGQIKRRSIALKAISTSHVYPHTKHCGMSADDVISTLLEILDTAKTGPTPAEIARGIEPIVDDRRSLNLQWLSPKHDPWTRLDNLIHDCHAKMVGQPASSYRRPTTRGSVLEQAVLEELRTEAASRLHVLYGKTMRERTEYGAMGAARRIVYKWANRTHENDYGPFKTDGSGEIDWKVLEAVASVMLIHFESGARGRIAIPQGFYYSIPNRTLADPDISEDWARATGLWIGTYSFIDYADLFTYNTEENDYESLEEVHEAHGGLMELKLKLNPELADDRRLKTKLPYHPALPPLHFSGTSRQLDVRGSIHGPIGVVGTASLCPSGREVRWKFIISYEGTDQWQLEGVQPGGIRSGPVYGVWSSWGHDDLSPVGAFMYVPEELCKKQDLVLIR